MQEDSLAIRRRHASTVGLHGERTVTITRAATSVTIGSPRWEAAPVALPRLVVLCVGGDVVGAGVPSVLWGYKASG